MERKINFKPGYDERSDDPKKNYGVHGMEIWFSLIGDKRGVEFGIYTSWMTPGVRDEYEKKDWEFHTYKVLHEPRSLGITYHSPIPIYEGQHFMGEYRITNGKETFDTGGEPLVLPRMEKTEDFTPCTITGGKCYSDGSFLAGDPIFDAFLIHGEEGVWRHLEKYYKETFGELK